MTELENNIFFQVFRENYENSSDREEELKILIIILSMSPTRANFNNNINLYSDFLKDKNIKHCDINHCFFEIKDDTVIKIEDKMENYIPIMKFLLDNGVGGDKDLFRIKLEKIKSKKILNEFDLHYKKK